MSVIDEVLSNKAITSAMRRVSTKVICRFRRDASWLSWLAWMRAWTLTGSWASRKGTHM